MTKIKLDDTNIFFSEYIELGIQYGFVILFSSAFPLAPLFAFLNNLVEIRSDAKNYAKYLRRPIPIQSDMISIWMTMFKTLTMVSIITNVSSLY